MYSAILATALTGLSVANAAAPIVPGTTGKLGDAAIVTTNPPGITYTATLPNSTTSDIRGFVAGTSNANGTGVVFNINLSGFPDPSLGPFCKQLSDLGRSNVLDGRRGLTWPRLSVPHPRSASPSEWQLYRHSCSPRSIHSWRDAPV